MGRLAQDAGWSVYCLATAAAVEYFLDVPALAELTGHPVRTTYRTSSDDRLPRADAVVVAPATYNTINKWAAGIADNYVLNQLAELTGLGVRNRGAAVRQSGAGRQSAVFCAVSRSYDKRGCAC